MTTAISPDGTTLLIVTSGSNRNAGPNGAMVPAESNAYVVVYDNTGQHPVKPQVPNTFVGLAWHPHGQACSVSGGPDDHVHVSHVPGAAWVEAAGIPLGHAKPGPSDVGGLSVAPTPNAAGLAVNPSGTFLVIANHTNDRISVVAVPSRTKVGELGLRPGKMNAADEGKPGGAYPLLGGDQGRDEGLHHESAGPSSGRRGHRWRHAALRAADSGRRAAQQNAAESRPELAVCRQRE